MKTRLLSLLTLPLGLTLMASSARAQDNELGISFGLYSGEGVTGDTDTLVAPRLDARIGISEGFGAKLILPLTSLSRSGGGEGTFRFGNVYIGGDWRADVDILSFELGAGLTLPTASTPDDAMDASAARSAYMTARGLAGLGEFWLYQPDTMAFVVPARAKLDLAMVEVRGDVTWAALIPTADMASFDTTLQTGLEALINVPFVGFGARAQAVWVPTVDGDKLQLAVAPLVEAEIGPVFARTMFLVNLDGPSGFSFEDRSDRFWGWHLGAGVRF